MRLWLVLLLWVASQLEVSAQSFGTPTPAQRHATELGITTGGVGDIPGGVRGGEFWAMQLRWGKVLTAPHGPGPLRGTLEYVFELVPAMVLRQASIGIGGSVAMAAPSPSSLYDPFAFSLNRVASSWGTVYGAGMNPFLWQYNFTSHESLVPYLQMGGGLLLTTRDFPAGTSSFNFTPQGGIGVYWFARPHRAVSFGVRYHHISNAGISKPNPGHNALYFYTGLSWWR
ncbi:MAG: acyloxyacyl hydrolase [Acidobacteria bacterium]|nr:acyloxyacyl hydrolase [Acidobacteriota bacterium]